VPPGENRPDNNTPMNWAVAIGSLVLLIVVLVILAVVLD